MPEVKPLEGRFARFVLKQLEVVEDSCDRLLEDPTGRAVEHEGNWVHDRAATIADHSRHIREKAEAVLSIADGEIKMPPGDETRRRTRRLTSETNSRVNEESVSQHAGVLEADPGARRSVVATAGAEK